MIFILSQLIAIAIFILFRRFRELVDDQNTYSKLLKEKVTKNQNLNPLD